MGNQGGPGNPHARQVGQLRTALLESVTEADVRAIAKALLDRAKGGDILAARELLNRVLGKSPGDWDANGPLTLTVVTGVPN